MTKIEDYVFPNGLHLLTLWQAGNSSAKKEITRFFDAAIAGDFDKNFSILMVLPPKSGPPASMGN